jgi:hypothetical protein
MNKAIKAQQTKPPASTPAGVQVFACAACGGPITVADNANGGLVSINVDGHAKAAHRVCPENVEGSDSLEVIETREPGTGAPIHLEVGDRVRITIDATVSDLEQGFIGPSPTFVTATDKGGFKLTHPALRAARIERFAPADPDATGDTATNS